jgi:hypothetical protein
MIKQFEITADPTKTLDEQEIHLVPKTLEELEMESDENS